jgi:two-component sensor histidine kinase
MIAYKQRRRYHAETHVLVKAKRDAGLPRATRRADFQQPADCPIARYPATASGSRALEGCEDTEAELRKALQQAQRQLVRKDKRIQQTELLRRESDHRLLNGLQMVASLLSTQSRLTKDSEAAAQLNSAANRVVIIGSVHRRLHALDCVESVELKQYLETLCQDMAGMLPIERPKNTLVVEGITLTVPTVIGIPLGFIVSELVTNSARHAKGKIAVSLAGNRRTGYALSVSDAGPGVPEGFDPAKSKGLGMKIVLSFVKLIDGQLLIDRGEKGQGARFTVRFSAPRGAPFDGPTLTMSVA